MFFTLRTKVLRWLPMLERHEPARQFVKFCLVGATNVAVYLSLYLVLTRGGGWYFLHASLMSWVVSVSWSFYWNRRFTFRLASVASVRQYQKFVLTNAVSGLLQNTVLYLLVEGLGWYDLMALAVVIVLATFWNFAVTKFWAFRL